MNLLSYLKIRHMVALTDTKTKACPRYSVDDCIVTLCAFDEVYTPNAK